MSWRSERWKYENTNCPSNSRFTVYTLRCIQTASSSTMNSPSKYLVLLLWWNIQTIFFGYFVLCMLCSQRSYIHFILYTSCILRWGVISANFSLVQIPNSLTLSLPPSFFSRYLSAFAHRTPVTFEHWNLQLEAKF